MKIDDILLALAARGQTSDAQRLAMVWIDRPGRGCYVRAADILKIETNGPGEAGSVVTVVHPSGQIEILRDARPAKSVRAATERVQVRAVEQVWRRIADQIQAASGRGQENG